MTKITIEFKCTDVCLDTCPCKDVPWLTKKPLWLQATSRFVQYQLIYYLPLVFTSSITYIDLSDLTQIPGLQCDVMTSYDVTA